MEGLESGSVWPASTFDEEQIREVYSRYGLAMYMVQVLEHGMVNAGIIMRTLGARASYPDEDSWLAAFDGAYEAGLAKTYGNMLRQLETLEGFPVGLLARLRAAKEDRDVLAHRFFRQNDLAFMNPQGRTAMIAWCEERVELFKGLSDEVDAFLEPIQESHGISKDWLERAWEQTLRKAEDWRSAD
jgi:hypothetical protein